MIIVGFYFCRYVLDSETAGPLTLFMLEVLYTLHADFLYPNEKKRYVMLINLLGRKCLIHQDWCQRLGLLI